MSAPHAVIAGRYRLVTRLAAGGMGSVWEAWDEVLQRPVAVKQLLPQPGLSEADAAIANNRAMREARITARLHHPHAVPVYDVVDEDGRPCLIMQYLPSRSLQAILAEKGILTPAVVARIGAEIGSALAAAHEAGIVHRDVKPGNVLIAEDGTAKLTDFGVSHAIGDVSLTSTGMVTGTPAFLAPESARGLPAGPPADVFSLGATLYAALEGTPPFGTDDNPMAVLHKVASGQVIPPRRSGALGPLLTRMLATDPGDRPPMIDVARTLSALHADLPGSALPTTPIRPPASGQEAPQQDTAAMPVAPDRTRQAPPPVRPPASGRPPAPPSAPGRNRRTTALALIAGAVVLGLAVLFGFLLLGNHTTSDKSSAPPGTGTTARAKPTAKTTSSPIPSNTSSAPASSTAASSATASTTARVTGSPTPAQLVQAITSYYALLPSGTDQGWNRLTARYQRGPSKNRHAYQAFWDSIDQVSATDVQATAPATVDATITYHFKSGQVSVERTDYTLVSDGGILKIDSSTVLSSQSQ